MFLTILEDGSKVVSEFYRRSCLGWIEFHPTYSVLSALVAWYDLVNYLCSTLVVGFSAFLPLIWRHFLWALGSNVLPYYRGFPKLSAELLRDCKRRPRKLLSDFCCFCLKTKKDFQKYSLLSNRIFSIAGFPNVLRGGKEKIAEIEDLLAAFSIFYYILTLSHKEMNPFQCFIENKIF